MTPSTIIGYAARAVNQPLEPLSYEPLKLGEHDVRVEITHCGLCHTDIQAIDNYYDITSYPFVPGHEIVGRVVELGTAATELKLDDRVGIGWQGRSCGQCEWCLKGDEQLCQKIVQDASWTPYGGFAPSIVVDSRFAYPLPAAMPSDVGAVLMCAGVTVYHPLKEYLKPTAQKIGIIGVGGLGHLAIQFARALGYEVTAISSLPEKKEEALKLGAHHFIVSSDTVALRDVAYGFDLLLCTASSNVKWEPLLEILKKKGKLILAGFPDISLNSTDVVAHQLSIVGSFLGNRATMREMLIFAQEHSILPMIETMPMSQVNEAIQRLRENKVRYRIVLVNKSESKAR